MTSPNIFAPPPSPSPNSPSPDAVYSVKQLAAELRDLVEDKFREVWVEGEISNLAEPRSGHKYFSLKDDDAVMRCVLFKNRLFGGARRPADGMQALVRAKASVYGARGDLQLIVEHLEDAGEGALRRAFELLRRRLAAEGLFSEAHKKPLPACPRSIGVITSKSGAALHDIRVTLARRFPLARLVVYPVAVQGDSAADDVVEMLTVANRRRDAEVLIVARGGGSLEDLQAFNSEAVARAIFASELPVVSAIGHETDFTIADMAADRRAPTPTAAAEIVAPDMAGLLGDLRRLSARLRDGVQRALDDSRLRLDYTAARLTHPRDKLRLGVERRRALAGELLHLSNRRIERHRQWLQRQTAALRYRSPQVTLAANRARMTDSRARLTAAARAALADARARLERLTATTRALSPLHTLQRGYAILTDRGGGDGGDGDDGGDGGDGRRAVITDARQTRRGQALTARVAHGQFICVVDRPVEE